MVALLVLGLIAFLIAGAFANAYHDVRASANMAITCYLCRTKFAVPVGAGFAHACADARVRDEIDEVLERRGLVRR